MYINQFSVVVFKRQHYVFHIFTGYTFVRHFPVLQIQRPLINMHVGHVGQKLHACLLRCYSYGKQKDSKTHKVRVSNYDL